MRAVDLIERKRDAARLSAEEIDFLIQGYVKGEIPDYQMAAFCMAVVWRGMDATETASLTASMVASGERLDLSRFGRVVDTHSTGGVGDKTTLVVTPPVAACGLPAAKMPGSRPSGVEVAVRPRAPKRSRHATDAVRRLSPRSRSSRRRRCWSGGSAPARSPRGAGSPKPACPNVTDYRG